MSPLPVSHPAAPPGSRARLALVALLVALATTGLTLALHPDYGPTWDSILAEYPYGEAYVLNLGSGEHDYLVSSRWRPDLGFREPHPDFSVGVLRWVGTYPFTGFLSGLSCKLLWTELGWVPPLIAHNLANLPFVLALVVGLVVLLGRRHGLVAGVSAAVLLLSAPRFLAHSFNNLKDVPEACLYNATLVVLYAAVLRGRLREWAAAGVLLGWTLAQRPNAFFLPPQFALFLLLAFVLRRARGEPPLRWSWRGLGLASLLFLGAWFAANPVFWVDTAARLEEWARYTFGFNTFLHADNVAVRRQTGPLGVSLEALRLVLITTPTPLLALALVGLLAPVASLETRLFLLLGAAVPVGRTLIPGFPQYDGVRHYLEFYPPLAALGGLGVAYLARLAAGLAGQRGGGERRARWAPAAVTVLALAPGVGAAAATHPNGIAYFNALVGGLSGAQARGVRDATDYWGNAYWQGLAWLREEAEPGATLVVPIAPHVVRCAAPIALREDLRLPRDGARPLAGPLYVMYLTRRGLYTPLVTELDLRTPAHEVRVQGGAILRVHRLEGPEAEAAYHAWAGAVADRARGRDFLGWLKADPARMARAIGLLNRLPELGRAEVLRGLEELMPVRFHGDLPAVVDRYGFTGARGGLEERGGPATKPGDAER